MVGVLSSAFHAGQGHIVQEFMGQRREGFCHFVERAAKVEAFGPSS